MRFMTTEWAQAVRQTFNEWPGEERKASKLPDFWAWIDMIGPFVTGRLGLSVRDLPPGTEGDTLVLDFEAGVVKEASISERSEAEKDASFLLAGDYSSWQEIIDGYDVGKAVMYRKLMLEKGDTLQFFTAAFFWTELLAAIQTIPVEALEPA